jgi:hypothetical protein
MMRTPFLPALVVWSGAAACGTLASPPGSGGNLPSSGVGPFRPLARAEMPPFAPSPFVLDGSDARYREPSVVSAVAGGGGDVASGIAVLLFAVARVSGHDVIVRTRADDARSFYGTAADNETGAHAAHSPAVVLAADRAWEGVDLAGPSALRVGSRIWLYYAGAGGIGLATSDDGLAFAKTGPPVLGPDARVAWETTPPHAPSVAPMPDGSWRMFYGAGRSIGEAASADGVAWTRVDADPRTAAMDPVLSPGASFDAGQVDDPVVLPRLTPAGRLQVRVLYTGYDAPPGGAGGGSVSPARTSAVGFAARFGEAGPLERQPLPVYLVGAHEAAPALFEFAGGTILYVQQDETADPSNPYPAIAAAVAPESSTLGAAGPFPATP